MTWHGHSVIMGMPGSGKSYLAGQIASRRDRVIAIDPGGQFNTEHGGKIAGAEIFETRVALHEYLRPRLFGNFRVIYRPLLHPAEDFVWLCGLIWAIRCCTLLADEVRDLGCSAGYAPDEFGRLFRMGRHRGICVIGTTQTPATFNRNFTSVAQQLCIFRLQDPSNMAYFKDFMPREFLEHLPSLPDRVYLARNHQFRWQKVQSS